MSFDDEDNVMNRLDYDGGDTKGHSPSNLKRKSSLTKPQTKGEMNITSMLSANLQNILPALLRIEDTLEDIVQFITPFVGQAYDLYIDVREKLTPYGIEEISTCLVGFCMMFFGGFFITTVAVYEAIVQGGLSNFKLQMQLIYDEFKRFKAANKKDDQEDLDNDGVADVKQISAEKYAVRKFLLALRATDPDIVSQSLHSLYTIFIAVAATLRLQFARTISLGASLGDQIEQPIDKIIIPQVKNLIDEEYHKWLEPVGMYTARIIGVLIAFQIQRILSTIHTGIKGARVFTKGLTDLSRRNGYGYLTEGYFDEILSAILAGAGIVLQLFMWSEMPIIVKLAFFPAFLVESMLSFFVSIALTATGGP